MNAPIFVKEIQEKKESHPSAGIRAVSWYTGDGRHTIVDFSCVHIPLGA
jgi:hypothetical protein